ncbi:MAG: hypothetical protein QOF23_1648, partial [Solirubrobacterales bacterium]|nr:hypothetical protein [Solirubrobacterales bacterium]
MTKDLALLVGGGQEFQTTQEFLASIDENLQQAMAQPHNPNSEETIP